MKTKIPKMRKKIIFWESSDGQIHRGKPMRQPTKKKIIASAVFFWFVLFVMIYLPIPFWQYYLTLAETATLLVLWIKLH
jgi:hypothetical protein